MSHVFAALDLPAAFCDALSDAAPRGPHIRTTAASDLHLTLHFLGKMSVPECVAALSTVRQPVFDIVPTTIGCFTHHGDEQTVWLGVELTPGLTALHAATATALAAVGFSPEKRPYFPHITLARCGEGAPR